MLQMITVTRAKELIAEHVKALPVTLLPLELAQGLVLAKNIYAPYDIPSFPQSSMDGYALSISSINNPLKLVGEMAAGSDERFSLSPNSAIRIFTGAAVPQGADTVLIQEKASLKEGILYVQDEKLKLGDNIRPIGSEIKKDSLAMSAGDTLTPAALGFLAGMGIAELHAIPKPRVSIIITGNELTSPGTPLHYGQVFESNSYLLRAVLEQLHIVDFTLHRAKDDPKELSSVLQAALDHADLVLITGGVSVGDYDFTMKALEECGVNKIFHKIRQRPGKPILFGMKKEKAVFGLPGNPASVLTCFYQYVYPAIGLMMQMPLQLKTLKATLTTPFFKNTGLTHFLKADFSGSEVRLLQGQESYKLNSFAKANCLVVIPEQVNVINSGEEVEINILPE